MERLTTSGPLSQLSRLINLRLIKATIPHLLNAVGHGSNFLVNGKVVLFIFKGCFLRLNILLLLIGIGHTSSASWLKVDAITRRGLVNHLAKVQPYAITRTDFRCPDGSAIRLPSGANKGAYVKCEDWDRYQYLMRSGDVGAEQLLLKEGT